ncbi:LuxE/PaaK family acyltransferase [Sphingobacterium paludis]|uniref:Acyl-protein synthetase LuxE n=1 Tax=Sphingobacterium paludis TaxID=1476465 RepID=A0A4R7DEX4_9SPHI|nr:acyl transferase [Sphingobacterium paludis]TDS17736.1 acyl-protein synthetase LuxE [Sphingobacterium paludis]
MRSTIFSIDSDSRFEEAALSVFNYQYRHNTIYQQYVDALGVDHRAITQYQEIPFLPIEFFKTQYIYAAANDPVLHFTSSGTTGTSTSKHAVADVSWYEDSFRQAFRQFYGDVNDIAVLALLPSYLEREGSSLIYMVDDLIAQSAQPESGYFLYNHDELYALLLQLKKKGTKTILIGVTYALLDFSDHYQIDFPELIVMETGGMKGKRKEMIREELHNVLCSTFNVQHIHSEYGMTELLSQAYSAGQGRFKTPPWMKVLMRDTNDPLSLINSGQTGAINVIDLANYHSCAFLATQDLGKRYADGSFEVLGRFDNSDIRGCNLLVQ